MQQALDLAIEQLLDGSLKSLLYHSVRNQLIITQNQEVLMATIAELQTQLDAIKASETAEATSLTALGTALTQIIALLQAEPSVPDAIVQKATDIAAAAAANTASAAAKASQASGAVPPAA